MQIDFLKKKIKFLAYLFFILKTSDSVYLLILSSVCTAYAFIASLKLMKHLTPFTVMLTINLEPVYAILLAVLIFGDKEKIEVNLNVRMAYKFIKILPLAFRTEPINYASVKDFDSYGSELMYFGVSGYEIDSLLAEFPSI